MRTITKRIHELEKQFGTAEGQKPVLFFLARAGWQLAIDEERCLQILEESGLLRKGPLGMLNFLHIPHDLNAEETETWVRENAADICGSLGSRIKVV
jgi:hypothetical protein